MDFLKTHTHRLLRKSEKYFKTDMVYLAKGGFWFGLGQAISSLSALALAIAFANLVPPETYGTYKYILSIAGIFAIFTLPGLGTAIMRTSARGGEGVIHTATRTRVLFSLLGTLVAIVGSTYYFLNNNIELAIALLIIAATIPVFDTFTLYLAHLIGKRRFDLHTKYQAITQIVSTVILVITILITHNIAFVLLAYFVPISIIRFILYVRTSRTIIGKIDPEETKKTLTYGKHLTAISILGIVASNIDKVLFWKFLGPAQLAIYAFAIAVPEQIRGPLKGVGELAFPKFAQQNQEEIRQNMPSFWRKFNIFILVLLGISVLYIIMAPFIFKFLFPKYMESVIYSQIFSLGLISAPNSILIRLLESQKKIRVQYILETVYSVTLIVLLVILIPTFGILGGVISIVISRLLIMASSIAVVFILFKPKLKEY